MAKKGKREVIVFACDICKRRNYTSTKNRQKHPQRLQLMKFCPGCGKHTLHKEAK